MKTIAQSGAGGSQYVTDAKNLTYPLSGVTYVDGTSGDKAVEINNKDYGVSSGILICFNTPAVTGKVEEIKCKDENIKAFQGIIITQNLKHFHIDTYGTVMLLAPGSDNNCNGNKDHWVRYSSTAIESALSFVAQESGQSVGGTGKNRMTVAHWWE